MTCRATASPAIATAMIQRGLGWWQFYYTMVGAAALELVASGLLFWPEDGQKFRENNPKTSGDGGKSRTATALKNKVVWILSAFLFVYMGVEGISYAPERYEDCTDCGSKSQSVDGLSIL